MLYPPEINYVRPESLKEALSVLNSRPNHLVIAGGTVGVLALKKRLLRPSVVVDVGRLSELRGIELKGNEYTIGSGVKMYEIVESEFNGSGFSLLRDAALSVGDPLLRNMGTVGGNVCLGDPSNDLPPALLALNAELRIVSESGSRKVKASEFYVAPFRTKLQSNEMLHSVSFREPGDGYRHFYYKHYIRHLDHSVINAALIGRVNGGRFEGLRVALGGAAFRIPTLLDLSWVKELGQEEISRVKDEAIKACSCTDDRQGSGAYKKAMLERILQLAMRKIAGDEA